LEAAVTQAPAPLHFKGVRDAEGAPVTAQRVGPPFGGQPLELLIIQAREL
jgi:hypothetical protein